MFITGVLCTVCGAQVFFSFIPLDKRHVPENLWKLSVTYLFKDTDFPIGGL